MMQSSQCSCPILRFQQISGQLEQDALPIDRILTLGSEFTSHLNAITHCERCIRTQRITHVLLHITSRLVCFYEAAHANTVSTTAVSRSSSSSSSAPASATSQTSFQSRPSPQAQHGEGIAVPLESGGDDDLSGACQSGGRHMRLGSLTFHGSEARLLGEVVLMDACSDLIEKLQEWKLVMDEHCEETSGIVQDEVISGCLDRLAKLTGFLHFGGMSGELS